MKKVYLILAVIGIAAIACNKIETEEIPETPETPEQTQSLTQMTFKATMEGAGVKTALNLSDGSVSWVNTDEVKFMWYNSKATPSPTSGAANSSAISIDGSGVASFTVDLDADMTSMFAVYPKSTVIYYYSNYGDYKGETSLKSGRVYIEIPSEQTGLFKDASIAAARWQNGNDLQFYNLCGLLQVRISNESVKKIVVSSTEDIAGILDVTFTKTGYVGIPLERATGGVIEGYKEITVNITPSSDDKTYYIAVRPCDITDLSVSLYDASNNLIGTKSSANTLSVARKQVRKLGTLADRLFFTESGGSEPRDGRSWDTAYSAEDFRTQIATTNFVIRDYYLAKGDYEFVSEASAAGVQCQPAAGSVINVYGGYPISPNGTSLEGRNVVSNTTKIYNDSGRTMYTTSGKWLFDGLTFTANGYTGTEGGNSLMLLSGTESARVNNCIFENSTATGANYGSVRVDVGANFNNCVFSGNTTKGNGGALYVHGGTIEMTACVFKDNYTESSSADIYADGSATLYVNACYFGQSSNTPFNSTSSATSPAKSSPVRIYTGSDVKAGFNNCVVSGCFGSTLSQVELNGNSVVVNSTMYGRVAGANIAGGSSDENGCRVINCITINNSSNGYSFTPSSSHYINIFHSILTNNNGASLDGGSVTEKKYNSTDIPWSKDDIGSEAAIQGGKTARIFSWDRSCESFTKTSLSNIKTLIGGTTGVGSGFLTWLEDNGLKVNGVEALAVDIRGQERTVTAMWPGSYEGELSD